MKRKVTVEIPEGMTAREAEILVRDALVSFVKVREDAESYIMSNPTWSFMIGDPIWLEEKVREVRFRIRRAWRMLESVRSEEIKDV